MHKRYANDFSVLMGELYNELEEVFPYVEKQLDQLISDLKLAHHAAIRILNVLYDTNEPGR